MSAPRPLLELMDLQADVAQGRSTLRAGPVRVEAPAALLTTPISAPLDALLAAPRPAAADFSGAAVIADGILELL